MGKRTQKKGEKTRDWSFRTRRLKNRRQWKLIKRKEKTSSAKYYKKQGKIMELDD